ncbi:hypothetical protein PR048_022355, partial [Dryococelus australis]
MKYYISHLFSENIRLKMASYHLPHKRVCSTYNSDVIDVFPNAAIALRLYLTLPISKSESESTNFDSTMSQGRLNSLAVISSEHVLVDSISFSVLINMFAVKKARKKFIA